MDVEIHTHHGVSRIIDYAFSVARRSMCMVDKSEAVRFGGRLWQRYRWEAAERHPHIETPSGRGPCGGRSPRPSNAEGSPRASGAR
jgi:isocitrate/isopropylmalate dehydrogenase